jgi:RNA polymerase sigma-70 factor (ECF subfamily)
LQGHDWQAIVRDHGPAVWQTTYRLLANHSDAADCFQETFLAAFEIAGREPVRNVPGLLVRLATTRAIDRLRQRTRQEQRRTDSNGHEQISSQADPVDQAQTSELASQLREQIGRLPPQEARVFCLRYLNELSYRQIARELNVAINVVGVSLYRAKAKLRAALAATQIKASKTDEVSNAKET